MVAETSEFERK